jgi:RNA-directed DNA polymerase
LQLKAENKEVLMLSATVKKRLDALGTLSRQGKRLNGLFRLMEAPILWQEAYANIYANDGATTPGTDGTTLDGFSEQRVTTIIPQLKAGTYCFQPVRRAYIPKPNGKKRPLGIPSGNDKLVQEVVRIILNQIYEPIFSPHSHGFRPGRSPHTALDQISHQWCAIKWMVDMDIQDYFNTISHEVLMKLLEKRIEDKRFLRLIKAMLSAGYLEDWTYHTTYSGVPQGGICSPILANVVLHELDVFMEELKHQFEHGKRRKKNPIYHRYCGRIERLRRKGDILKREEGKEEELQKIQQEIREVDRLRKQLPSQDPFDQEYKRLFYCRYADDFAVGVIGSHADAQSIRQQIKRFLEETLKLAVAEEKSHIRPAKQGMNFVGYEVRTYSGDRVVKVKRGTRHITFKSMSERIQLHIPLEKLPQFCKKKGYGNYETAKAIHKPEWTNPTDAEIILAYNAELRGFANYYSLAHSAKMKLHKLAYVWQGSLLRTLACKHKSSVNKITQRLKTDDGLKLVVKGKEKTRVIRVFQLKYLKTATIRDDSIDTVASTYQWTLSRTEITKRLSKKVCEYCEATQGPFEVHHIRKLKDVAHGKALWQQMMAARHRKTMVLCLDCHQRLHAGKLPDRKHFRKNVEGEPCELKGSCTVPGEGVG